MSDSFENEVTNLFKSHVEKHLADWRREISQPRGYLAAYFGTDNILAQTLHDEKTIILNGSQVQKIRDVWFWEQQILHEIAHALVGHGQGHGLVWEKMAAKLGVEHPMSSCSPKELEVAAKFRDT